jgi:hypothetical protein
VFCKHKWNKVAEVISETPFEVIANSGHEFVNKSQPPSWMFNRGHLIIMVCDKCGKIYKRESQV